MILDAVMTLLGFRYWSSDEGPCLKVPRWYLWFDPGANKLAKAIRDDMRKRPEAWR